MTLVLPIELTNGNESRAERQERLARRHPDRTTVEKIERGKEAEANE